MSDSKDSNNPDIAAAAKDVEDLMKRVADLEKLWTKFEGAGILIKIAFWVIGPLVTGFLFLKDHWKP